MSAIVCADGAASLSMQWGVGPCRPDHSEFRKVGEDVLGAVKYLLCGLADGVPASGRPLPDLLPPGGA